MNFSPRLLRSNFILSSHKVERLYCRNFIFTLLAFDLLKNNTNKNLKPLNITFHITKKRKHVGSILRAPYKCKSAQFSLGIYRYFLTLTFSLKIEVSYNFLSKNDFVEFNKTLLNSYNYFESALVTQVSRSLSIPINVSVI